MAGYRFTKTAKAVLTHLVLNGQAVQIELPGIVGYGARTVMREVKNLKMAGYIEFAGLVQTKRRPRFVLRPTFFGALEILIEFKKDSETMSQIAERHRDLWVVFEEWDYIANHKGLLDLTISAIQNWLIQNTIPEKGVGKVSLREDILPQCKHELVAGLFWGSNCFPGGLIFEPEILAYFKRNPKLKKHLDNAIEKQAELYKMRLVIIEAWAKGKLISKVLKEWSREWPKRT